MPMRYDEPVEFDHVHKTSQHDDWEARRSARHESAQEDYREASQEARKLLLEVLVALSLPVLLKVGSSGRRERRLFAKALQLTNEVRLESYFGEGTVRFHLQYMKYRGGGMCNLDYKVQSPEFGFVADPSRLTASDSEKMSALATEWLQGLKESVV